MPDDQGPGPSVPELEALIADLHEGDRLRVWSIVVTVFGDAVQPRGGELWLGTLQLLMERLRIDGGALRTAMSRLTADGWLERERIGRRSFYRLSKQEAAVVAAASARIYGDPAEDWDGIWSIRMLGEESAAAREGRRRQHRQAGFGVAAPAVMIRPETPTAPDAPELLPGDADFSARLEGRSDLSQLIATAWPLSEVAERYHRLIDLFAPLQTAMASGKKLTPLDAMAIRTLLLHAYRRAILRDPPLPARFRPEDDPAAAARALTADLYGRLAQPSEAWLTQEGARASGPLPAAEIDIAQRFQAL